MEIVVTGALGRGKTPLSAFDDALFEVGVANYNLIKLSSIIPVGAKIKKKKIESLNKEYGFRLYAVYDYKIAVKNESAWAGLGWFQKNNGQGVFVEHSGTNKKEVERLIKMSILELKKRRKFKGKYNKLIIGQKNKSKFFICSLAIAKYKVESWDNK